MNDKKIVLRPANPTQEEGLIFAEFLVTAFEGLMHLSLGKNFKVILARAYKQPEHCFSYENTVFSLSGDTITGMISAYPDWVDHKYNPLWETSRSGIRSRLGAAFLIRRLGFLGSVHSGDFYIQALAVDPAYQSKGIGKELLLHSEIMATNYSAGRLVLDVAAKNTHAIRIYKTFGMNKELSPAGLQSRFIVKMAKNL
ncbi:MAG: N-acetyltransferase [Spirochaetales bacterium]|nr:N-acetyltransferase [Spirochaetales bacterium]